MRIVLFFVLSWPSLALAQQLSLDDIVARARAVAEKKPGHVTCDMTLKTQLFDKTGKLEHHEEREGASVIDGDKADLKTRKAWRDGQPVSDADLAKERQEADKDKDKRHDYDLAPLAAKNKDGEKFELLRRETLWGHDAYVLKVTATRPAPSLASGLLWIDAADFVELKGELVPAKLPAHADWLKVQEQYGLVAGVALPSYLRIAGGGHFLFLRKSFESTMRWTGCRD